MFHMKANHVTVKTPPGYKRVLLFCAHTGIQERHRHTEQRTFQKIEPLGQLWRMCTQHNTIDNTEKCPINRAGLM